MIGSLRGTIAQKKPDSILLDVGGVGYLVNVPLTIVSSLPDEGSAVFLHIHTHVREDAIQLYGFASYDQKRTFITLLGITGIGPKVALNILSGISHEHFLNAIEKEDVAMLCRVPGLGKKTAQRLILELKEKLPTGPAVTDHIFDDTLSALINLGYKKAVAQPVLDKVYKKGLGIEELLRETLKKLTGSTVEKA